MKLKLTSPSKPPTGRGVTAAGYGLYVGLEEIRPIFTVDRDGRRINTIGSCVAAPDIVAVPAGRIWRG